MKPRNSSDTHPLVRIPHVMKALEDAHSHFRLIEAQSPEAEAIADWIESHFPIIGVQIDWSRVQSHECVEWSEIGDLVRAFDSMAHAHPGTASVIVTWSDALRPSLEMKLSEAIRIAPQLFEGVFDTWIVCQKENWCIEMHHEGTLCFGEGRSPFVFLGTKLS
jgi:hypothetical protein